MRLSICLWKPRIPDGERVELPQASLACFRFFFFNDTATTEIYTLSLHDALPISQNTSRSIGSLSAGTIRSLPITRSCLPPVTISPASRTSGRFELLTSTKRPLVLLAGDRKSTRLNSSHQIISYAVFCLKKKSKRLNSSHQIISYASLCLRNKRCSQIYEFPGRLRHLYRCNQTTGTHDGTSWRTMDLLISNASLTRHYIYCMLADPPFLPHRVHTPHQHTISPPPSRFFFELYGDHRDLHSFPTRRSFFFFKRSGAPRVLPFSPPGPSSD